MADPNSLQAFEDVVAALQTITTANGYHSDVGTNVEEVLKLWDDVHTEDMPHLGCSYMKATPKEYMGSVLEPIYRLKIIGQVYADTPKLAAAAALKLEDDVKAALYADVTRGEHSSGNGRNAISTTWVETFYDFRDPQRGGRALIEMNFDIKLYITTAGS